MSNPHHKYQQQLDKKRYPNGYWGKIQYWTMKLNAEVMNTKSPDLRMIDSIHRKLNHFIDCQWKLDNPYQDEEVRYKIFSW